MVSRYHPDLLDFLHNQPRACDYQVAGRSDAI
jgi:hypothetical protein